MTWAFEITPDDVQTVCQQQGQPVDEATADRLHGELDADLVEREALRGGTDMGDQTDAAYEEIARQLTEAGVFKRTRIDHARRRTDPKA